MELKELLKNLTNYGATIRVDYEKTMIMRIILNLPENGAHPNLRSAYWISLEQLDRAFLSHEECFVHGLKQCVGVMIDRCEKDGYDSVCKKLKEIIDE